jgi:hypothetical protein
MAKARRRRCGRHRKRCAEMLMRPSVPRIRAPGRVRCCRRRIWRSRPRRGLARHFRSSRGKNVSVTRQRNFEPVDARASASALHTRALPTFRQPGDGVAHRYDVDHWIYSGRELRALLQQAGFRDVRLFGDLDGRSYGLDATRLIAVATA